MSQWRSYVENKRGFLFPGHAVVSKYGDGVGIFVVTQALRRDEMTLPTGETYRYMYIANRNGPWPSKSLRGL